MTVGLIKDTGMKRYTVVLTPDIEDGGYVVTVPALPGCVTQGETVEEATAMAKDAIQVWIATLIDRGEPVPEEEGPSVVTAVEVAR